MKKQRRQYSSSSSAKSEEESKSSTGSRTTMEEEYETRDSCYFPGCRKDANCDCQMCLDSINNTLDLMPLSVKRSSMTKLSRSRPKRIHVSPVSFDRSLGSTPRSSSFEFSEESPALKSTARFRVNEKEKKKARKGFLGIGFWRLVLVLIVVGGMESGFSRAISGVWKPVLNEEMVKRIWKRSMVVEGLSRRLRILQSEFRVFDLDGEVSNCSSSASNWEVNEDGWLLNSRCVMYKSLMEEVSIWGWPLQTAGLLKTGFYSTSLTILSGRVTEWSNGNVGFMIRKGNSSSWVQSKWSRSVVQMDPNTWILEYRRSSILDSASLSSAVIELLKWKTTRMIRKMKANLKAVSNEYKLKQEQIPT